MEKCNHPARPPGSLVPIANLIGFRQRPGNKRKARFPHINPFFPHFSSTDSRLRNVLKLSIVWKYEYIGGNLMVPGTVREFCISGMTFGY
jgi:hypothetical protein